MEAEFPKHNHFRTLKPLNPNFPLLRFKWHVRAKFGKIQGGLTNGGLSPKFSEKIGGKSFLENRTFSGQIGAISGLVGAFSGPIGTNSYAPHSHGGRAEIAPKGPFLARLAPFGLSPPLLSPRLDYVRAKYHIMKGGVKSPKIRGGVKIFNFRGSLNLTPFYRDSIENPQFGGQKSKLSKDNFRGEFPPPSSVRYVLTPPIPVSDKWHVRAKYHITGSPMKIVHFDLRSFGPHKGILWDLQAQSWKRS